MMTGFLRTSATMAACLCLLAGCSVSGNWRTVSIDPPGAPFPLDALTLDDNGQYTATSMYRGRPRTSTGAYQWERSKLIIMQSGHASVTYGAKQRRDGKLELTFGEGEATVRATLERQDN